MSEELNGKIVWCDYMKGWGCSSVKMGRGSAPYVPKAVQQQAEMEKFIDALLVLLPPDRRKTALEIGLKEGGTHLIWKMLFKRIISVEMDARLAVTFVGGLVDREGSMVICSNSTLPYTRELVKRELSETQLDFLFIDGDHNFPSVEADYMNYEPMVASGGVVAFHDYKSCPGVRELIDMIQEGKHPLIRRQDIIHILDANTGISYYLKP